MAAPSLKEQSAWSSGLDLGKGTSFQGSVSTCSLVLAFGISEASLGARLLHNGARGSHRTP